MGFMLTAVFTCVIDLLFRICRALGLSRTSVDNAETLTDGPQGRGISDIHEDPTSIAPLNSDPILRVLSSRKDLSQADIQTVLNEIHKHGQAISGLDKKLSNLSQQANAIRREKQKHEDIISRCRGILTLARRAPDEILAHIFELCAADGWNKAPLVCAAVCSSWRRAALAYPRVWSHVHCSSDSFDPLRRTDLWISRAGQSPLHITVDARSSDTQLHLAVRHALDHVGRWHSFTLNAKFVQQAAGILSLCNGISAPQLREVSIASFAAGIEEEEDFAGLVEAFQPAPNLRTIGITFNKLPVTLPTNVVELRLELAPLPNQAMRLLDLLTSLEQLSSLEVLILVVPPSFEAFITFPDSNPAPPTEPFVTTLPHLRTLTINGFPDYNPILQHLSTPLLRGLYLWSSEAPLNYPHEATGRSLRNFVERVTPPLKLLALHDIDLPQDDFVSCFRALPGLEELRLHETEVPDEVFEFLKGAGNGSDESAGLCPKLRRLDLRWCEQLSGQVLVDLVTSRQCSSVDNGQRPPDVDPIPVPIEEVTVIHCAMVEEKNVLDLARMTVCSVVVRDLGDHCRTRDCCNNSRYRQRLRLRHLGELGSEEWARMRLILD